VKDANEQRASLLLEIARTGASSQHTLAELFDAVVEHLEALGREPTTLHGYEGHRIIFSGPANARPITTTSTVPVQGPRTGSSPGLIGALLRSTGPSALRAPSATGWSGIARA
jgi:hypothetical protein